MAATAPSELLCTHIHPRPRPQVGFFLHTPFPSSEIYRTLPYREEVLHAVLKADLIGFHTYDYARHFISSCTRILGLEGTPYGVEENGFLTRVAAFPIGIDPDRFVRALHEPKVVTHIASLRSRCGKARAGARQRPRLLARLLCGAAQMLTPLPCRYAGRQVMLGVDRLDMIKGIPQKLLAFEKFLDEHPEWHERVLLVQIAVPSRVDVPEYQHLRSTVHEIVGRINGARVAGGERHAPRWPAPRAPHAPARPAASAAARSSRAR